jgi:UDP-N-acetylmuramoyl-L-alanyl-D-glutamate--2,6-diaminopimelate ligase
MQFTGVSLDSRRMRPGWLYVALPGNKTHGARFAAEAVAGGAAGILTDAAGSEIIGDCGVPVLLSPDPRSEMAQVAAEIYGYPARQMRMYGVTGTAGKTTTVMLLAAALEAAQVTVGTIGTLGFFVGGREVETSRTTVTTPESPDVQALLAQMRDAGAATVAMEVTSHALALHRVDGIVYDVAAFTNLGHDHLDYHGDQESYFQAKATLFTPERCRQAVVNIDDPYGRRIAAQVAGKMPLATTSVGGDADYVVTADEVDAAGRHHFRLRTPTGEHALECGLIGAFGVRNAMVAAAILESDGVDLSVAGPGFATAYIPGRMQRVELGPGAPFVVVDFAHTPETVGAALSALPAGRRIAVLGAGGERDKAKRRPMGEYAARNADVVVVTDDNPRSETPADIRAEVLAGARGLGAQVIDGGDRRAAIATALRLAGPGDWVAILGRGHEREQELSTGRIPFSDVAVVREVWRARG